MRKQFLIVCSVLPVLACTGQIGSPGKGGLRAGGGAVPGAVGTTDTGASNGAAGGATAPISSSTAPADPVSGTTDPTGASVPVATDGQYPPAPMLLDGDPIYTRFMRLTNEQWDRTVQDILQLDASPDQARTFQSPVVGATDFINNEAVLQVTNDMWQQYQLAAESVVEQLTSDDSGITSLYAGNDQREFITLVGRRAFRRPLTESEISRLQAIFDEGSALSGSGSTFVRGAGLVVETLLQSPHFLYRTELGTSGQPLNGYEIASKLSFLLLGTSPSDALLDSAAAGALDTPEGIRSTAEQMLNDPRAAEVALEFHDELFEFWRFSDVVKDVPEFNTAIRSELEESSRLFFQHIFADGLGLREILTSTQGYVGPQLADLYGIARPSGQSLTLQDLGPERAGYFSQIPFLLLYGDNEHSDAIHRGVVLNFDVLCANIPPPPGAVPGLAAPEPNQTDRERVVTSTAGCGDGCHDAYINPLGFAFENFDGLGRVRTTDEGMPVDTSSAYPFVEGTLPFASAPELMETMASTQMAHACYTKHLASFALQRDIAASDQPLIDQLTAASMQSGSSVRQLLLELVTTPAFVNRPGDTT